MFIDNKYAARYFLLVEQYRFKNKEIGDHKHHILPRSLGGTNYRSNLIYVSPRIHFHLHLLLIKMTNGIAKSKMTFAIKRFGGKNSGRSFAHASKMISQNFSGKGNPFYGKTHSDDSKQKISINHGMRGKSCYDVWLAFGGKDYAELKQATMLAKRSISMSGKPKRICINNGTINKMVHPDNIESGWTRGRLSKQIKSTIHD